MKKLIKPEDRYLYCKHLKNDVCKKTGVSISNGFVSKDICGGCAYFEMNKGNK